MHDMTHGSRSGRGPRTGEAPGLTTGACHAAPARRRSRRGAVAVGAAVILTTLLLGTTTTGAAYRDQAYARTESLSAAPVPPFQTGLARNARMVDTGLGLSPSGDVHVWGRTNMAMNGGASDPGTSRGPQRVPIPEGTVRQVSGGIYNANALDTFGTVWGWGRYTHRDGTDADKPDDNPRQVRIGTAWNGTGAVLDGIISISSTEYAGAGIRADGTVWHWGDKTGYGGNAGVGASRLVGLPDPTVAGNRPVYLKGAYTNFFVILENGDVWYWGGTGGSSLPSNLGNTDATPQKIMSLAPWTKAHVAAGQPYVVAVDGGINMGGALLSDGQVLSWGSNPRRIGGRPVPSNDPGDAQSRAPAVVPGLAKITSMQFGFTGVAMLDSAGTLWGYGASDDYGRFPQTPTAVDTGVVQYAAGQGYYIWQKSDATFWGRGYNPAGALGTPLGTQTTNRKISSIDLGVVAR